SPDGWVRGTSWLTGVNGYLPAVYTQRTAESDAWTLHRAMSLTNNGSSKSESDSNTDGELPSYPHDDAAALGLEKSEETFKEWENYWAHVRLNKTGGILNVTSGTDIDWKSNYAPKMDSSGLVSIIIKISNVGCSRCGTASAWTSRTATGCSTASTRAGRYVRKDLNLPLSLAARSGGKDSYALDTPLTRVGWFQAELVGEGLRLAGACVGRVYASAALRCVETAHALLKAELVGEGLRLAGACVGRVYASAALRCVETAHALLKGSVICIFRSGGKDSYALDTPLTRVGWFQAELVGEGLRLAGACVGRVYASAALRCVETAHALLKGSVICIFRSGGKDSYALDTPLTRVGWFQAELVGEGLRLAGACVGRVYASAALRCVETAHALLKGSVICIFRSGGKDSYALDTPLTRVGWFQAELVGEGLRLAGACVGRVYASAALRCVETAHALLKGSVICIFRSGGKDSYALDTPLTRVGWFQAELVGEGLRLAGACVGRVYASAALRCVETAHALLKAELVGEGLRLAGACVGRVYASAALRCVETAHALLKGSVICIFRSGGKDSYALDTPLTRVGWFQAELVGEGLRLAGACVGRVYASAALRCVETAHALLKGSVYTYY
ncbi:hypothetical protein ACJJTC_018596, partial [Scirpophaga incertulas]